jgi:hypothetical protein
MKFKAGDKVWALSKPSNELGIPVGSYKGVIIDFVEAINGDRGIIEFYNVEVPDLKSEAGMGFVISHLLLRPRDDFDDPPGDSDAEPLKKVSMDDLPKWDRSKLKVLTPA